MALTSQRHQQCLFCDLRLLASGTWRQYIPVVYKSPHWRALLWLPWTLYCGVEGQLLPLRPQVLFPKPLPWVGPSCPQPRALPFPPHPQSSWCRVSPPSSLQQQPGKSSQLHLVPHSTLPPTLASAPALAEAAVPAKSSQPHLPGLSGAVDAVLTSTGTPSSPRPPP